HPADGLLHGRRLFQAGGGRGDFRDRPCDGPEPFGGDPRSLHVLLPGPVGATVVRVPGATDPSRPAVTGDVKPYLLLSTRAEDAAAHAEHLSFARKSGLAPVKLHQLR